VKSREFLDILTRVVNSKSGPQFLAVLHQLREILEEAGIAEGATVRIESGKPIRRRAPEDVDRRAREPGGPPEEAAATVEGAAAGTASEETTPAAGGPAEEPAPAGASPGPATEPAAGSDFIQAGPNHLIRNPDAQPPAPEAASPTDPGDAPAPGSTPGGGSPPEGSIREIVQEALEGGAKTMAQIREIIHQKKGPVSHLVAQVHAAMEKLGAQKGPRGAYMFSSGDAPPPGPGAPRRRPGRPRKSGPPPARSDESPAEDGDAGTPDRLKQLSILESPDEARGGAPEAPLPSAPAAEAESVGSPAESEPG
jgi:hypothetical protein